MAFAEVLGAFTEDDDFLSFPSQRVKLGGYGFNIGAQWRMAPGWSPLGRVNNLADKDYRPLYSSLGAPLCSWACNRGSKP